MTEYFTYLMQHINDCFFSLFLSSSFDSFLNTVPYNKNPGVRIVIVCFHSFNRRMAWLCACLATSDG